MRYEGGFQGRTNKLVDGCYSFWQGAVLPIVQSLINKNGKYIDFNFIIYNYILYLFLEPLLRDIIKRPLFNRGALQEYVLICCQRPNGGLLDKPGK